MKRHRPDPLKQQGLALVEAVIAAGVLGVGLAAAAALVVQALTTAQHARQSMQAQALLQEALDCAISRAEPCPASPELSVQGVVYRVVLERRVLSAELTEVEVSVNWLNTQRTYSVKGLSRVSSLSNPG